MIVYRANDDFICSFTSPVPDYVYFDGRSSKTSVAAVTVRNRVRVVDEMVMKKKKKKPQFSALFSAQPAH